ncbi:MAG TPA: cation-transporting P-type ATPase [Acidimicrobiales bacterium]|nr:cation-transporting P-type ATPase [Acidimicrobiales bacterium]
MPPPAVASTGLSDAEARRRLAAEGRNELPEARPVPAWRRFAAQLVHFFALMLWVAGVLAFVAGMPQLGVAIFGVVLVNGAFAFAQEHRAERAAQHLRDLLPRRATVVRDGRRVDVDAACLVAGDLVVLRAGDRISADLAVAHGEGLSIDASMLTGESEPVPAATGEPLFAGCFVVRGEGMAVVVATGAHTRLASIAELTHRGRRPRSPLERELGRVVRTIAVIAVAVGLAFFGISLLVGGSGKDGFLLAVGVTVALVPEGLLPTVTLSLAVGAQDMARHHALVRRLESVETLGSTTFICTDKTGTLTRNQMSAVDVWTPLGSARVTGEGYGPLGHLEVPDDARPAVVELARAAARCSEDRAVERDGEWVPDGDPTEAALYALARRCGVDVDGDAAARPVRRELPFDPERRMMSMVVGSELLVKGAPESVLARCRPSAAQAEARAATVAMARQGLRMLAVARRQVEEVEDVEAEDEGAVERDLTLLGLVGIEDPPREGVDAAIADCRAGGIRIAMLTGDNPETAAAIGRQIGLIAEGGLVLSGPELPDDDAVLGALVDRDDGVVISRVTPEDKLRIARSLQARGHVVAMTGDGVNDGPALQTADIGVAMGAGGTDVAREAADLVLLDDHFATIVEAVAHGRVTFANIRRFLTYHLVCNVAELTPFLVWAISGGRFPLALGVLQILSFDIGAEVVPALALGTERGQGVSVSQPLQGRHLIDRKLLVRVFGVLGPAESLIEMAAFCVALLAVGWAPGHAFPQGHDLRAASGTAFATVIIGQMGVAFACRSATRWPGRLGWFSNRLLLVGIGVAAVLLVTFLYVDPIARVLGQAPPPAAGWVCAAAAGPLLLGVDLVHKVLRRRRAARRPRRAAHRGFSVLPQTPFHNQRAGD